MIFSEKHLRRLANIPESISINTIIDAINSIGFEVEQIINFNHVDQIKFGKVLEVSKNPHSAKLNVCQIQFNDQIRTIQTAAQNVNANDYLMAFVPGSRYKDQIIEAKELAQIKSEGMLISLAELGFNTNLLRPQWKDEIFILNQPVDLNLDPVKFLDLHDNLIEVSILSNRSDAQSYYVFAKELAAYFQTKFTFNLKTKPNHLIKNLDLKIIDDQTNQLMATVVDLDNTPFQLDLQKLILLLKANYQSTNDWDDYCAWMMLQSGICPQVFNYQKLKSNQLKIATEDQLCVLKNGDQIISTLAITTKDEFTVDAKSKQLLFVFYKIDPKLARTNIKLTKTNHPVAINSTREIANGLIEIAYQLLCLEFNQVSNLINQPKAVVKKIKFDKKYLINYAGMDLTKEVFYDQAIRCLISLDFQFNQNKTMVTIPNYRHDLNTMQDLVEEVFRFYGLNNFEPTPPLVNPIMPAINDNLEQSLTAMGYTQVWTYTLINKDKNDFNPFNFKTNFELKTFVSEEYNTIRHSMALAIYQVYQYNSKRKIDQLSLFDLGMINDKKALILCSNTKSFTEIKNDLQRITNQYFDIQPLNDPKLHPHYNAGLFLGGQQVGWIGKFNPFYINDDPIFAEVLLDVIYHPKNQFINYDNQPLKERDLTISLNQLETPAKILDEIKFHFDQDIFSIELIDVFNKAQMVNWTYKIKLNAQAIDQFDQLIKTILK